MSSHRKPRSSPFSGRAVRTVLLAAGAAGVATAVPAHAATGPARSAAVVSDSVFTNANRLHHTQARDSFTIRQFGKVNATSVRNQANAVSMGCSVDDRCRSVALSFQIVTVAGDAHHLKAVNVSNASNKYCDGCQTLAGAYQFVVSTPHRLTLDAGARRQLDDVHRRLDVLTRSTLPAAELQKRVDALAGEVNGVLQAAVAKAPKGTEKPDVTLHRRLDGWPGH